MVAKTGSSSLAPDVDFGQGRAHLTLNLENVARVIGWMHSENLLEEDTLMATIAPILGP
jgi:hypothetical protein